MILFLCSFYFYFQNVIPHWYGSASWCQVGATDHLHTFPLPVSIYSLLYFFFVLWIKRTMTPLLLCLIFMSCLSDFCRPQKMCSSMMGGLSIDADLIESLTPEPFTNVRYPFLFTLPLSEST